MTDPRLAAALGGALASARDLGISVEVRRAIPAHPPRPSRPSPVMPPPVAPPATMATAAPAAADPATDVAASQAALLRAIWARMSPEARRIFLASLA